MPIFDHDYNIWRFILLGYDIKEFLHYYIDVDS